MANTKITLSSGKNYIDVPEALLESLNGPFGFWNNFISKNGSTLAIELKDTSAGPTLRLNMKMVDDEIHINCVRTVFFGESSISTECTVFTKVYDAFADMLLDNLEAFYNA